MLHAAVLAALPFTLWTLDDATRLTPASHVGTGATTIRLYAARNETVSFQIALRSSAALRNVTLAALPVGSPAAGRSPIAVSLFREYFVEVPHASALYGRPQSLGNGVYPDGLIPFVDPVTGKPPAPSRLRAVTSVGPNAVQPYWVDVAVPAGTKPGDYRVDVRVSAAYGSSTPSATVSVPLHVWRFTIPVAPSLDSDFQVDPQAKDDPVGIPTESLLLQNRLEPNPVLPLAEPLLVTQGLKMAAISAWSGAYYGHCKMRPPPSVAALRAMVRQNAVPYVYAQPADEIESCPNLDSTLVPMLQRYARNLHAAGSLSLLTQAPIAALETDGTSSGRPAVDIWAMLPPEYDAHAAYVASVVAKGQSAWSYTALAQDAYSPKWEIDVPPADYRVPALIDVSLGLSGELYWAVDAWTSAPWDDVEYVSGGSYFAGEGILVYPGADVGTRWVAPSMRLKWIRDGMYDADEVALLSACGDGAWARARVRTVAADWHRWTEDASALDAVHLIMANRLDSGCYDASRRRRIGRSSLS